MSLTIKYDVMDNQLRALAIVFFLTAIAIETAGTVWKEQRLAFEQIRCRSMYMKTI